MRKPLSNIPVVALATVVALAGVGYATAAPGFISAAPAARSDVVLVIDSKIVRRDEADHDGDGWKKRRHDRDGLRAERRHQKYEHRRDVRNRDTDGGAYRPRATTKFAYDAYGNLRIYDGKRRHRDWEDRDWDGHDWSGRDWDDRLWDHDDRWRGDDWDETQRRHHGPRIIRVNPSTVSQPSLVLQDVLTATPD